MSGVRFDVLQGFVISERDLASIDLWDKSLSRSRQRRRLAEVGRKSRRRRKGASLATTAALATVPVIPQTLAAAELPGSGHSSAGAVDRNAALTAASQRVVLKEGSQGPLVAAAQRRLNEVLPVTHIAEDGIFGPQTRGAVVEFQRRQGLPASGIVDARAWSMLFKAPVLVFGGSANGGSGSNDSATSSTGANGGASGAAPTVSHASRARAAGGGVGRVNHSSRRGPAMQSQHIGGPGTADVAAGGPSDTADSQGAPAPTDAGAPSNDNTSSGPDNGSSTATNSGSGARQIAVVAPAAPPHQTSTYVLTNGVALPLPRQYIVGGSVDQGVDYAAPGGTPEYAMGDGVIIGAGISGFGPNAPVLKITDGPLKGMEIYYGHAGPNLVHVGQKVHAGQQITIVGYGIVGISTGPHLEVGFYPPGAMGSGSRMLSLINSMMAQHPTGRAWGSGGQMLARTTRQRAHTSRTKHRRHVVHRHRWAAGGLTVATSSGATISTAPASPALTGTGGGSAVTSTAPPVVTVTQPPAATDDLMLTKSSAPGVASSAPVASGNTSTSESAAPASVTPAGAATDTVQSGPAVGGAQSAPSGAGAHAPAVTESAPATAGSTPAPTESAPAPTTGSRGAEGGVTSSTPTGSSGVKTTTDAAATAPGGAPQSQAPREVTGPQGSAQSSTGPAASVSGTASPANTAPSAVTATSQAGAAAGGIKTGG